MSGSLFDFAQYDPAMGGMGPAGAPQPGATPPPVTLGTMWNWLKRQPSPITGLAPGQQASSGPGGYNWEAAGDPYQQTGVPAPGGPIQAAPKAADPTTQQAPLPTPPVPPGLAPQQWPPQASNDAPTPPTPAQAQASAADTSGANYNTDVAASQPSSSQEQPTYTSYSGNQSLPRGMRNNNPLNLTFVQGQPGLDENNPTDGRFGRYLSIQHGIGSATNQLLSYGDRGLNTTRQIVSTWAPPGENDTNAYVTTVSKALGVGPDDKINLRDPATMQKLVGAMAQVENGQTLDPDAIKGGVQIGYDLHQGKAAPNGTVVAGPGAPTNGSTSGVNMAPQQQQQLSALGIDPSQFQLPFDYQAAVQPSTAEKLYRMAAALQGNAGQAAQMMAGDRQKMFEANNNALATQRLAQQLQYQNAGLGIRQQVANNGTARVGIAQQNADTAGGRLKVAQDALAGRLDPNVAGRIAQGKQAGTDAAKDINTTLSTQAIQADAQGMADIDNAQKLIQQNPSLMGPTMASRWSRFAAETGLTGDAADLNALQKMTTDQRNQMLSALTNGHVGGIRSNAELQNISKAVADVGTSPAAAQFILNMQKSQIEARNAWRQEIQDRYQNDPESITGQRYAMTRAEFLNDWNKAHPLPEYNSPTATSAAGQSPGTNASGSTKGAATLRYDQATGKMVPM